MDDLRSGTLTPLRERVLADPTICLEIRNDYVVLYYRGGKLLELRRKGAGYTAFFDTNYAGNGAAALSQSLPAADVQTAADVAAWISAFPELKLAMDLQPGSKDERDAQQLIVRDNNFGRGEKSNTTDYFICDIEYDTKAHGRFDMIAVHWPSLTRKKQDDRRLVIIEAKYGDEALTGTSSLHSHIEDINGFLGEGDNLRNFKDEMVGVFNQKRTLGFLSSGRELEAFSDEPPMLLLLLVNHNPNSTKLGKALASLPPSPHAEIYLATGCLMGYGLSDPAMLPLNEAVTKFEDYI